MRVYQIVGRIHPNQPEEYVRFQFKTKEQAELAMSALKDWKIRELDVPESAGVCDPMPTGGVQ